MRIARNKPVLIVAVASIIMLLAVGGYAYWTSDGEGDGTATTSEGSALVVVQTSAVTAMGPGIAAQPLAGNFDNSSGGPSYVGSVSVVVTGTDSVGCDAGDYTITGSPMVVNAEVPNGAGQGSWSGAAIAFDNSPTESQDACKGATVTLGYAIVG